MARKAAPYPFFLEAAGADGLERKPMFGSFAFYRGDAILFIVRERDTYPDDNGIWLVSDPQHHESLRAELPSMRSIRLFDAGETTWQNIPAESESFEEEALHLAELVLKKDPRLGKVPKARKKSLTKKKPKKR